jgi:uncharacterized protein DUF3987
MNKPIDASQLVAEVVEETTRYSWESPDWSVLDDRRGELPDFPLNIFSQRIGEWVKRSAHGAGATPDHVANPLIGIASGLIGTARRVRASNSWSEPCAIWTAIVGNSGTGKTPGMEVTKRALDHVEEAREPEIANLQREHEERAEKATITLKQWREDMKTAAEAKQPLPPKPAAADAVGEFVMPRLYVSDVTIERLGILLRARPRGMLRISDELAGLFLNMSRFSGGQDNEFWLEAWNGSRRPIERINRPSLVVPHLLVALVGGFQPDKLSRSLKGDMDGMYARFLFSWPEEPGYRPLTDDALEFDPELVNALQWLVRLEEATNDRGEFAPRSIPLSRDARQDFEHFRHFLHTMKEQLDGREREWASKGPAAVLRITGTLSLLEAAWSGSREPAEVDAQSLRNAVGLWRGYFEPHSRAALRQIGLSERHSEIRRVLRWIRATGAKEVSVLDVRRKAMAHAVDYDRANQLVTDMVHRGWLKPKPAERRAHRPALRWEVNPLLSGPAISAESAITHQDTIDGASIEVLPALPALPASDVWVPAMPDLPEFLDRRPDAPAICCGPDDSMDDFK